MASRARIDAVLSQAVDAKEVPGVAAMAATDKGLVYEGAFPHRVDDESGDVRRGHADGRAGPAEGGRARAQHRSCDRGAASPGGVRRLGRAEAATREAAHHAPPPHDPHGGVHLRGLERARRPPEFYPGGGGLHSTGRDYLAFVQMLLHGGSFNGARVLRPESVAFMHRNAIGETPAGILKTQSPRSNDVDLFPGAQVRWSLGHMFNQDAGPNGRSAGTVSWGGLFNTYYWIDPAKRVTGLIMTQILPFADTRALALDGRFERAVYDALGAG